MFLDSAPPANREGPFVMISDFPLKLTELQKQLLIRVAAGIIFFLIGYTLAVHPVIGQIKALGQATKNAKARSQLIAEIHRLKAEQTGLTQIFSAEKDRHLVLGEITTLATKHGLDLSSVVPNSVSEGHYTKLTLTLNGQAGFISIFQFLKSLEQSRPDCSIATLNITVRSGFGGQAGERRAHGMNMVVETYLGNGE